jgi:hypothetical protein
MSTLTAPAKGPDYTQDKEDNETYPLLDDASESEPDVIPTAQVTELRAGMYHMDTTPAPIFCCTRVSRSSRVANAALPVGESLAY